MSEVSEEQKRQSKRIAAIAVAVVAVLSLAFIGIVSFLDDIAYRTQDAEVPFASVTSSDPFYVLLIGSDSRKGTALYTGNQSEHAQIDQHSDIMTLMRIDPLTYTITLVTIPRDTVLEGSSSKINDSLLGNDPAEVVDAAERLTGVEIDSYLITTFTSFEALVDAMGGVTVDVPRDVTVPDPLSADNVTVKAGNDQMLDGSEALVLARARKEYGENQDANRQTNVRNLEIALIQKALAFDNDKAVHEALLGLEENVLTNMDIAFVGNLVIDFITHRENVVIHSCTGPYSGGNNADGLWVVEEDAEAWAELMAVVDSGGDPTGIIEPPSL